MIVGVSGVFSEIQTSIHFPRKRIFLNVMMKKRLSFSLLIVVAFLLMVSPVANSQLDILSDRLKGLFSISLWSLFYILNKGLILLVICCLFITICKILPNSSISWKHAFAGAIVTSVLFLIGKFVIGYYQGHSLIGTTYGTAASIVILMLWIFYSSIILYFGACYTAARVEDRGHSIRMRSSEGILQDVVSDRHYSFI